LKRNHCVIGTESERFSAARLLAGADNEHACLSTCLLYRTMLRAQARVSLRVLEQRGSLARVQAASISSSSAKLISSRCNGRNLTPSPLPSTTTAASRIRTMSTHYGESAVRPEPDKVVQDIADYVHDYKIDSDLAWETARLCLIDTIGCGLEGLRFEGCRNLLGPVVEGTTVPNGEQQPPYRLTTSPTIPPPSSPSRPTHTPL
jgi:2-methylcitrate dehydratase